tara:strand:- start:1537 stop:2970 length:1434 start_codon:yes stop_codon:yes gene_type:complete
MAQQLYFSRDSEMALEIGTKRWTIPVLEGFSFSQATNVTEIGLNEMESTAGVSRRGRRAFNDSLSAAEFSFSTYVRPFISQGGSDPEGYKEAGGSALKHHAVEEALWALFGGPATYASDTFTDQFVASTAECRINLLSSNVSTLGPDNDAANIYFKIGTGSTAIVYKLKGVVLNEATINFDIDGIAQIDWSGMASKVESESAPGTPHTMPTIDINEAYAATTNFIRNRLTTLGIKLGTVSTPVITNEGTGYSGVPTVTIPDCALATGTQAVGVAIMNAAGTGVKRIQLTEVGKGYVAGDTYTCTIGNADSGSDHATATIELNASQDPDEDSTLELETGYGLTLTGGSITMANNVTYTTPEELGIVNVPVGHVTGSRAVSGSFTCYLASDSATSNSSKDFFDDMAGLTTTTSNKFDLTFAIGGAAGTPRLEIHCPQAHVDIPTHAIEDLVSIETTFNALPATLDSADDADLRYVGKAY